MQLHRRARARLDGMAPGTKTFLASLSIVTVCFGVSKIFSSLATVIVARFLGAFSFGEATIILLMAQVLSMFMLGGQQVSVMKYGSGKEDAGPEIATTAFFTSVGTAVLALGVWLLRAPLGAWLEISAYKIGWAIAIAVMFAGYTMFTSVYQALNLFKGRGLIEVAFAVLLLPGLALGHVLTGGGYETILVGYAVGYCATLPFMIWRFRRQLSPRYLFKGNNRELLTFGLFSCLSNLGFIATFMIQPLQLQWYADEKVVGIFRLYCQGSVNMAAFATSIFYTVFFPRLSVSQNRGGIWTKMTRAWQRAAIPVTLFFAITYSVTVWLSGKEYPLVWQQVLLFSLASTLITITNTIGQMISSQGIAGARLGLALTILSGGINLFLSWLLIPRYGITGAIIALAVNYAVTLVVAYIAGARLIRKDQAAPPATAS